jgi:5,10-methylenetetrahydromethanopterin reductase
MRLSFQMLPEQPAKELVEAVVLADELGYHACYGADEIYHKDMWLLFAAAAPRTERIRLGPCVSPIYLRDPTYIAQLAATLDELSGGRAEVVFGIGNLAMLEQYGVEWKGTRPIGRLREAHAVMRAFLDAGELDFAGDFYAYSGVFSAARPVQEHLPLKIGAMGGPQSMRLAGELADGMLTAGAYSPEAIGYAIEQVRVGAEAAGRDFGALDVGDNLLGAISPDGDAARTAARALAAFYIPSMPPALLERHGLNRDELAPMRSPSARSSARWS